MDMEFLFLIFPPFIIFLHFGYSQASMSLCNETSHCVTSTQKINDPCCLPSLPTIRPKILYVKLRKSRSISPLLPPSSPLPQPPTQKNRTLGGKEMKKEHLETRQKISTTAHPPHTPALPIWSNWYFWLFLALFLLIGMAACGYWRRRKIYESSASQTLTHANGLFPTPTPSDDTPLYGPPLPFLPPAAYPAPPPYSEAARPSYDRLDHRHLYDALLSGRTVYDFYDRRHPNAYYDRYFLPDDTSSSETTSLLSYRLQRSCSAHLPKHHSVKKCYDMPPPYSEVAAKPELYPVVVVKGGNGSSGGTTASEVKSSKAPKDSLAQHHWLPPYQYYTYRSESVLCLQIESESVQWTKKRRGSISTPEGSQASSIPYQGPHQNVIEWWRGPRGTISPATLLASCSGIPSPASSSGPLPSDVSSLAPTSPPSPPAPTSPTQQHHTSRNSPNSSREFRDVLHKISQLPRASSPTSPSGLSSECHSPGGMLSPVPITPGTSPGSNSRPRSCSRGSQTPWRTPSPVSPPRFRRSKRPLVASLSVEGQYVPPRPQSLSLGGTESHPLSSSASTPNLLSSLPQTPDQAFMPHFSRSRINFDTNIARSRVTLETPSNVSRSSFEHPQRGRYIHRSLGRRWWEQQVSIDDV